jgi:hypothetical protein
MAFDAAATAEAIVDVLEGLTDIGAVQIGAPQSVGPQVSAWVGLGGHQTIRKATGVTQRETRYYVLFCYRVDGAEATAETSLMDLVDEFMEDLHADLTLAGTVVDLRVESPAADEPDYQLRAGKEYREYPAVVTVTQRGTYDPIP